MCDFYWQFFHRTYNLKETLRVIHGRNKGENGIIYNSLQNKNLFARSKLYNHCILVEKNQKQVTTVIEFKPWSFWSKFNILHLPHHLHLQASQYQLPHNLFPMLPNLLGLLKILPLPYPHRHTWNGKHILGTVKSWKVDFATNMIKNDFWPRGLSRGPRNHFDDGEGTEFF